MPITAEQFKAAKPLPFFSPQPSQNHLHQPCPESGPMLGKLSNIYRRHMKWVTGETVVDSVSDAGLDKLILSIPEGMSPAISMVPRDGLRDFWLWFRDETSDPKRLQRIVDLLETL